MKYKCAVIDLDGTIYTGGTLLPDSVEFISGLKAEGLSICYMTNASCSLVVDIKAKLIRLGILVDDSDIILTSSLATAMYCAANKINKVQMIGSEALKSDLAEAGIDYQSGQPQAFVMGHKLDCTLQDISKAINTVKERELPLIACNRDRTYPDSIGKIQPACGAITESIRYCLGMSVGCTYIGKPETFMLRLLAERHGYTREDLIVLGDSIESDIGMANAYECESILIGGIHGYTLKQALLMIKEANYE